MLAGLFSRIKSHWNGFIQALQAARTAGRKKGVHLGGSGWTTSPRLPREPRFLGNSGSCGPKTDNRAAHNYNFLRQNPERGRPSPVLV